MYRENYCPLSSCFRHLRMWHRMITVPILCTERIIAPFPLVSDISECDTQNDYCPHIMYRENYCLLSPLFQTSQSVIHRMITVPKLRTERMITSFPLVLDIPECDTQNGFCPHKCTEQIGGHTCSCASNFMKDNLNGHVCNANSKGHIFLYSHSFPKTLKNLMPCLYLRDCHYSSPKISSWL